MPAPGSVFKHHYKNYIEQLKKLDFSRVGPAAGADVKENSQGTILRFPCFNIDYEISAQGIQGPGGKIPEYEICIILSRYLIMASDRLKNTGSQISRSGWTGFRDLKESGPLTVYFRDNVETVISKTLTGRLSETDEKLDFLKGGSPDMDLQYDLALEIQALPKIPMLLLFNDGEEGFPPSCSVLFESGVETCLDAECIAMLGYRLAAMIKEKW